MQSFLTIIVLLAIFSFIFGYDSWLKKNYDVSPASFGGVLVGAIDIFLWSCISNAENIFQLLIIVIIAGFVLILLWAHNYKKINTLRQAVIMTIWQLTAGVAVIVIWVCLTYDKRNKKRK